MLVYQQQQQSLHQTLEYRWCWVAMSTIITDSAEALRKFNFFFFCKLKKSILIKSINNKFFAVNLSDSEKYSLKRRYCQSFPEMLHEFKG